MAYLRRLPDFDYFSPKSIKEASFLLEKYGNKAKILAGGTDLLVNMKYRRTAPQYLIGLRSIPYLDSITWSEVEGLQIGSLATHQSIADSAIIKDNFLALAIACSKIGTPQIRSTGTIGGNLCNAVPSADTAPPLIAFDAKVKLVSSDGERLIPLEEFLTGSGETALQASEVLTHIEILNPAPRSGGIYLKLPARSAKDVAVVGVAALITLNLEDETCSTAKIVLGAVAPTPIRVKKAEEILKGERIEGQLIKKAAQLASEEARPISDVRGSAEYRTEMVKVLTKHAISQSYEQAKSIHLNKRR